MSDFELSSSEEENFVLRIDETLTETSCMMDTESIQRPQRKRGRIIRLMSPEPEDGMERSYESDSDSILIKVNNMNSYDSLYGKAPIQ